MYLVFDTEMTGLLSHRHELTDPIQPHILQFSGMVFDEHGHEVDRLLTLVKPGSGAVLFLQAYAAHRITLERAATQGMEPVDVFGWFSSWAARVQLIAGRNVNDDVQAMVVLCYRVTGRMWAPSCPTVATMV